MLVIMPQIAMPEGSQFVFTMPSNCGAWADQPGDAAPDEKANQGGSPSNAIQPNGNYAESEQSTTAAQSLEDLPRILNLTAEIAGSSDQSSPNRTPSPRDLSPMPAPPGQMFPATSTPTNFNIPANLPALTPAGSAQPVHSLALSALCASGVLDPSFMWSNVYTVMLRNIPNRVTQQMLLLELDDAGFTHSYDFLYLPIDMNTGANRGYAFLNFVSTGIAMKFRMEFEGRRFKNVTSHSPKRMSVTPAALQGFEANHMHYSHAHVKDREQGARPLFLREPQFGNSLSQTSNVMMSLAAAKERRHHKEQEVQRSQQGTTFTVKGYKNTPAAMSEAPGAPLPSQTSGKVPKFCPYCGEGCLSHFKFCQFCGSMLPSAAQA